MTEAQVEALTNSTDNDSSGESETVPLTSTTEFSGAGTTLSSLEEEGSSVFGAIFNFTNAIIGAGAIGLGGAIAVSGGLISVALILFFGGMTKLSLDLVIRLSVETEGAHGSYEDLASVGLGNIGRKVVSVCKLAYSFGCLVAYVIVIKDNLGPGLCHLLFGSTTTSPPHGWRWIHRLLSSEALFTWAVGTMFILPLCFLRDMTPLANFSAVSVISMMSIVAIVVYLYFACPDIHEPRDSIYQDWFEIRRGVLESLGTFVFTFVSQHTVHLVFGSLKPSLRTVSNWKKVSSVSLLTSTFVSLSVGVFVYMTFWEKTKSDIFQIYPQSWLIDTAKVLLSITMIFTFPLPFFTCRELLILSLVHPFCGEDEPSTTPDESLDLEETRDDGMVSSLHESLLGHTDHEEDTIEGDTPSIVTNISRLLLETTTPKNWLLPGNNRQLKLSGHMIVTGKLWFVTTFLAIAAPSLGDVLDLVGCATGTVIAFILPGLLSLRIEGFSILGVCTLVVGGLVGTVGTYFSVAKLLSDLV